MTRLELAELITRKPSIAELDLYVRRMRFVVKAHPEHRITPKKVRSVFGSHAALKAFKRSLSFTISRDLSAPTDPPAPSAGDQ